MKRYFHKLDQSEIDKLLQAPAVSVGYIVAHYDQPEWCNHGGALECRFGCWSLCDLTKNGGRTKISRKFCKKCYSFNKQKLMPKVMEGEIDLNILKVLLPMDEDGQEFVSIEDLM